jgi:hypothetical protein
LRFCAVPRIARVAHAPPERILRRDV